MSRFYMTGSNSRGNTVSAAGRSTEQDVHLRGWRAGVEVIARPNPDDPKLDRFTIYATSGSSGRLSGKLIGHVIETEDGPVFEPAEVHTYA